MAQKMQKPLKTARDLEMRVNAQLDETLWYVSDTKSLSQKQITETAKWRDDIYAVLDSETVEDGIAAFKVLMKNKPDLKAKFKGKSQ